MVGDCLFPLVRRQLQPEALATQVAMRLRVEAIPRQRFRLLQKLQTPPFTVRLSQMLRQTLTLVRVLIARRGGQSTTLACTSRSLISQSTAVPSRLCLRNRLSSQLDWSAD